MARYDGLPIYRRALKLVSQGGLYDPREGGQTDRGECWEDERKRTVDEVSKSYRRHRNHAPISGVGQARMEPAYCPSGDRHKDGVSPAQALVWNVGTCRFDAKGEAPRGREYRCEAEGWMDS